MQGIKWLQLFEMSVDADQMSHMKTEAMLEGLTAGTQ